MPEFYNSIVFQPNRDSTCLEYVALLRVKDHLESISHPQIGGKVCYTYVSAAYVRSRYSNLLHDSDVSPSNPQQPRRPVDVGGGGGDPGRFPPTPFIILYNHGNAEDLGVCYPILKWLAYALGVDVIGYDYRGYGYSGSHTGPARDFKPTEKSVFQDADLMWAHLIELGYRPESIIILGRSVGGGPACYLAEQHHRNIAGLILESTFSSCLSVMNTCLPCLACLDMFKNKNRLRNITGCPILFTHGEVDRIVPFRCSCELLEVVTRMREKKLKQVKAAYAKKIELSDSSRWGRDEQRTRSSEPLDAGTQEHDSIVYESMLIEAGLRSYSRSSLANLTPDEATIGIFHRWHPGCGHNDVQSLATEDYVNATRRFITFAEETTHTSSRQADGNGPFREL